MSAAVEQGSASLAADMEQGGISEKMDWRERTYYWVRLNYNSRPLIYKDWDCGGRNYERRVRELKKIPGLKMHPLPSMALARWKREAIPEWAQMLVSCRKAHDKTLVNGFTRFAAEPYGNCEWQIVVEPVKKKVRREGGKKTATARQKFKVGDKVRILDGRCAKDYAYGWAPMMTQYIGKTKTVESVSFRDGQGIRFEYTPFTWDARYLELVEEAKGEKPMKKAIKEIKVRNSAGILKITAERELNLRDVFFGTGDDKLPPMQNPRLEIHQGTYGEVLVTLTDRTVDNTMFLAEIEDGMPPQIYVGHYEPEKRSEDYVTFEPWREK